MTSRTCCSICRSEFQATRKSNLILLERLQSVRARLRKTKWNKGTNLVRRTKVTGVALDHRHGVIFNMLGVTRSYVRHVGAFCASEEPSLQMMHSLVIFEIFHARRNVRTRRAPILDWVVPAFALKITTKHITAIHDGEREARARFLRLNLPAIPENHFTFLSVLLSAEAHCSFEERDNCDGNARGNDQTQRDGDRDVSQNAKRREEAREREPRFEGGRRSEYNAAR